MKWSEEQYDKVLINTPTSLVIKTSLLQYVHDCAEVCVLMFACVTGAGVVGSDSVGWPGPICGGGYPTSGTPH